MNKLLLWGIMQAASHGCRVDFTGQGVAGGKSAFPTIDNINRDLSATTADTTAPIYWARSKRNFTISPAWTAPRVFALDNNNYSGTAIFRIKSAAHTLELRAPQGNWEVWLDGVQQSTGTATWLSKNVFRVHPDGSVDVKLDNVIIFTSAAFFAADAFWFEVEWQAPATAGQTFTSNWRTGFDWVADTYQQGDATWCGHVSDLVSWAEAPRAISQTAVVNEVSIATDINIKPSSWTEEHRAISQSGAVNEVSVVHES